MDRCAHADRHNVSEYIDQAPDAATLLVSRSSIMGMRASRLYYTMCWVCVLVISNVPKRVKKRN